MLNSSLGSLRNGHENDFVWGFLFFFLVSVFLFLLTCTETNCLLYFVMLQSARLWPVLSKRDQL